MLRTFETSEETYQKFKELSTRENKAVGKLLNELIEEYIKIHANGNPIHPLDKWQDPDFKSYPAFKERISTVWYPYLEKCNEKTLKEVAEQSEAILNKALFLRARI